MTTTTATAASRAFLLSAQATAVMTTIAITKCIVNIEALR
jgi:hypothetical protein